MNFQLQYLIKLQKIDLRIFNLQDQQQKIPQRIEEAETPLIEATKRLKAAKETAEALDKERRERERDLSVQEDHLQKIRGRLTEIKTNKEYQAHLFEIELGKKKKDSLEEVVLGVLERAEENTRVAKELELAVQEFEKMFVQEKEKIDSLVTSLEQELSELHQKEQEVAKGMDATVYARYSRIKSRRKGFAVASVREGACTGCRLQLPPQLVAEVKRADQLLTCSYCYRILYWEKPGSVDAPADLVEEKAGG